MVLKIGVKGILHDSQDYYFKTHCVISTLLTVASQIPCNVSDPISCRSTVRIPKHENLDCLIMIDFTTKDNTRCVNKVMSQIFSPV